MDKTPEEILEENGYDVEALREEKSLFFRNPDFADCIIGITDDWHIVYSYDKMVEHLIKYEKMSVEEAIEWLDYNTLRSYSSEGLMPIVVHVF